MAQQNSLRMQRTLWRPCRAGGIGDERRCLRRRGQDFARVFGALEIRVERGRAVARAIGAPDLQKLL